MIIKNNDGKKKKKKKDDEYYKYGVGDSAGPQNKVITELKIRMFVGGRRGLSTVSVSLGLTGCLGSCWGLCSQIPRVFRKGHPVLWPLLFDAWSDFCPLPNPTVPEMLRVGVQRKPGSGIFYKRNVPALGFKSITRGFLGTASASPGWGQSGAAGATLTRLHPRPTERGHPVPYPHDGTLKLSNNFI